MNILTVNCTEEIKKHFKNENILSERTDNITIDTKIECKDNNIIVDGTNVIKYNENWKSNINLLLAKKMIITRTNKLRGYMLEFKSNSIIDSWKKINKIKNYYKGYKALIVTCGPSFKNYINDIYKMIDSNTILICIKRTFHVLKCGDFHILDDPPVEKKVNNKYSVHKPISIGVEAKNRIWGFNDISFKNYGSKPRRHTLYDLPKGIDSMSWDAILDKEMMIHLAHAMHGIGIPLCLHLGIKDIFVIGWDGLVPGVKDSHFYKRGKRDNSFYGSTAIVECNKHTAKFLKNKFDTNIYHINTSTLYKHIPKKTVQYCINFENNVKI